MNNILGVPMKRTRCIHCKERIVDDGYGDVVHEDSGLYLCAEPAPGKDPEDTVATK